MITLNRNTERIWPALDIIYRPLPVTDVIVRQAVYLSTSRSVVTVLQLADGEGYLLQQCLNGNLSTVFKRDRTQHIPLISVFTTTGYVLSTLQFKLNS